MFPKTAAAITWMMLAAQPALAQSAAAPLFPNERAALYRPDAAGTRREPEFTSSGIPLGGLRAHPRIEITASHDSNVFNAPDFADRSSNAIVARPSLRVASDWGRHEIGLKAAAVIRRYDGVESENSEEYELAADGRIDIDYARSLHGSISYGRVVEPRGAGGPVDTGAEPTFYRELNVAIGLSAEFGLLRLRTSATLNRRRYGDTDLLDLSFRDLRTISVTPRLDFALSPQLGLFATGTYSATKSLEAPSAFARDSTGGVVLGGVRAEIGPLLIGEVAAGWRKRDFDSVLFRDFDGFAFNARLDWYPTELVSVRLDIRQDLQNSGIVFVPAIRSRTARLTVYYDPLPNLRVTGGASYSRERFDIPSEIGGIPLPPEIRALDLHTGLIAASLRLDYLLNRHLSVGFRASLRDRGSSLPDLLPEFDGYDLGVSLAYAI